MVAPRVGAWIETHKSGNDIPIGQSHPVWVRGLKHDIAYAIYFILRRTPCGCVD